MGPEWIAGAAPASLALGAAAGWAARRFVERPPVGMASAVTALQGCLTIWALAASGTMVSAAASIVLGAGLLTLAATDLTSLRLPDLVTLPLVGLGLATAGLEGTGIAEHALGALAGWASVAALAAGFHHVTGRRGIGMGDAKLLAAAGAWCGWRALPSVVLIACAAAFLWTAARALREGPASAGKPLPFGVPLALAFWVVRLYDPRL